jgi:hypothetical protein
VEAGGEASSRGARGPSMGESCQSDLGDGKEVVDSSVGSGQTAFGEPAHTGSTADVPQPTTDLDIDSGGEHGDTNEVADGAADGKGRFKWTAEEDGRLFALVKQERLRPGSPQQRMNGSEQPCTLSACSVGPC